MNTALAPALPAPSTTGVLSPTLRAVTADVTGGLDGALRVLTLLRGRRYRVRDLDLDVREGPAPSRVTCTVVVTATELDLLVTRLRRLPTVVSAGSV